MRKRFIILAAAVLMLAAGFAATLADLSLASETAAQKGATEVKQSPVLDKSAEDAKKILEEEKTAEGAQKAEEAKKIIVAKVNGEEINMFMLTRAMNRIAPKYVKGGEKATTETTEKIKKEALDKLIVEELAVQSAIRQDITPTPEAIDKVKRQIKENLGSEQAYTEYLYKNNLTEDTLGKLIERSQRYELITAREVYGKVKVDEKLVHDEYEKEKGKYILPDNFVIDDVWFIKGTDEAAREKAHDIHGKVQKKGNDPNKLLPDGTFIVRRINVEKAKYPEIYKAITGLNAADLSGVILERDGFHIIKVIKYEKAKDEHMPDNILIDDVWFTGGTDEAAWRKAHDILETLRHSDNDPNKLLPDGTFVVRKINVKERKYHRIYEAMIGMNAAGLSEPIEEKDGFHIIKVIKQEPSRQATFEEARPIIEPKFLVPVQDKRMKEWEKELRTNAKIEIMSD